MERSIEQQEMVDYFKRRWQNLQDTHNYVFHKIDDDKKQVLELVDGRKLPKAEANRAHETLGVVLTTFEFAMLTAFCAFVEEIARAFASRKFPNDWKKRAANKQGSKFFRFVQLLEEAGFDTTGIQVDLDEMKRLFKLRNCIVHEWSGLSTMLNQPGIPRLDEVIPSAMSSGENIGNAMIDQLLPQKIRGVPQDLV